MELPHPLAPLTLGPYRLVDHRLLTDPERLRSKRIGWAALFPHIQANDRDVHACRPGKDRELLRAEHARRRKAGRRDSIDDVTRDAARLKPSSDGIPNSRHPRVDLAVYHNGELIGALYLYNIFRVTNGNTTTLTAIPIPAFLNPDDPRPFERQTGDLFARLVGATFFGASAPHRYSLQALRFPIADAGHRWPAIPTYEEVPELRDNPHVGAAFRSFDGIPYLASLSYVKRRPHTRVRRAAR